MCSGHAWRVIRYLSGQVWSRNSTKHPIPSLVAPLPWLVMIYGCAMACYVTFVDNSVKLIWCHLMQQQVRHLRNKKSSMPHGAHLFNGIIQINSQRCCGSSWNCCAFLPIVLSAAGSQALQSRPVWQVLSQFTRDTCFKFSFMLKAFQGYRIVKIIHRVPEDPSSTPPQVLCHHTTKIHRGIHHSYTLIKW